MQKEYRAVAKLIVSPRSDKPIEKGDVAEDLFRVMIAGVGMFENKLFNLTKKNQQEMWECEIIIKPRRKYKDKEIYKGMRIDQVLRGNYEDPNRWGDKYDEVKNK